MVLPCCSNQYSRLCSSFDVYMHVDAYVYLVHIYTYPDTYKHIHIHLPIHIYISFYFYIYIYVCVFVDTYSHSCAFDQDAATDLCAMTKILELAPASQRAFVDVLERVGKSVSKALQQYEYVFWPGMQVMPHSGLSYFYIYWYRCTYTHVIVFINMYVSMCINTTKLASMT